MRRPVLSVRCLLGFSFLLCGLPASAAVLFVNPNAPSPVPDGASWQTAYRTLEAALSVAASGDELWIAAASYDETMRISAPVSLYGGFTGTETERAQRRPDRNPAVIRPSAAVGAHRVLAAAALLDGLEFRGPGITVEADNVTIRNCALDGGGITCLAAVTGASIEDNVIRRAPGAGIRTQDVRGDVSIARNVVLGCLDGGIRMSGGVATGNYVSGNRAYGILASASGGDPPAARITGNWAVGNAGTGIRVSLSSVAVVSNNLVAGNVADAAPGIRISGPATAANNTIAYNAYDGDGQADGAVRDALSAEEGGTIVNNIVAFNSHGVAAGATAIFRHNCVYDNAAYNYHPRFPNHVETDGNIQADPRFANPAYGDFHIQPTSPCRDAGDAPPPGIITDIDGENRVQGPAVDIGMDESSGQTWPTDPRVIYAAPHGRDTYDGRSWARPKRTIAQALRALIPQGGEVWVAGGDYPEQIILPPFVRFYGGFRGNETTPTARAFTRHDAVVDGQGAGPVLTVRGGAYRRVGEEPWTVVDGLAFRNGAGIRLGEPAATMGGGALLDSAFVRVFNNVFEANTADFGSGIYALAGGVIIETNQIRGNTGEALRILDAGTTGPQSPAAIVRGNVLFGNSGAAAAALVGNTRFTNNTVAANSGGLLLDSSRSVVINNLIAYNGFGLRPMYPFASVSAEIRRNGVFGNDDGDVLDENTFPLAGQTWTAEPRFVDLERGDIHLGGDSPYRGVGDPSMVPAGMPDIDGTRYQPALSESVAVGADHQSGWPFSTTAILRVRPSGNDAANGRSWGTAMRTLQAAIDAIGPEGGEVWVAAGIYSERITLKPRVSLLGGFGGNETASTGRNWAGNRTIIDAGGGGTAVTIPREAVLSALDGFTVRNGRAASGGGIACHTPFATVAHNVIRDNVATSETGGGGGIWCRMASPRVHDNVFTGNTAAGMGAALYLDGALDPAASTLPETTNPSVFNNTIVGNSGEGGAVTMARGGTARLTNNIIAFNTSGISHGAPGTVAPVAPVAFRNNNVFQNGVDYDNVTDATGFNGNIRVNPRFANVAGGDFHLPPSSPCINAGYNPVAAAVATDLDGQPRLMFGRVDIGADEATVPAEAGRLRVVHVASDGDDARDGASWATAVRTVGAALPLATPVGGEVWVAAGTYPERVVLRNGVSLYGGFAGTETRRDQRDAAGHTSVLDGGAAGPVVVAPSSVTAATILEGFTIRNGRGFVTMPSVPSNWEPRSPRSHGGGLFVQGAPVIRNNTITANEAYSGAGIFLDTGSAAWVLGNVLEANRTDTVTASGAGTIYALQTTATISGNTIRGNTGAGVWCDAGAPYIAYNAIEDNFGRGVVVEMGAPVVTGNTIARNISNSLGGGLYLSGASAVVSNNVITDNASAQGAGAYVQTGAPILRNNVFSRNRASGQSYGGAVALHSTHATLTGQTIVGHATDANTGYGGISITSSTVTIANTIVAFNREGIEVSVSSPASQVTLLNNCVYGNIRNYVRLSDPTGLNGNLMADPRLASADYTNIHLLPDSPCIDAGNDGFVEVAPGQVDIDGQPRRQGARVDIGADEFAGPRPPNLSDVSTALRIAAGLAEATPADKARLDVVPDGAAGRIDLLDAAHLLRAALNAGGTP